MEENIHMESANLSKLRGTACVVKVRNTMQNDFEELEKWLGNVRCCSMGPSAKWQIQVGLVKYTNP